MNIKFFIDYPTSPNPLFVNFKINASDQVVFEKTIDLQEHIDVVDAEFDLFHHNQQHVVVEIGTNNFKIIKHQLIVRKIKFDDFYSEKKLTCSAKRMFDELFLQYADRHEIFLDRNANDNNCLNFTGNFIIRNSNYFTKYKFPMYKSFFNVKIYPKYLTSSCFIINDNWF